jgi:hypothetical protein
MKKKEEEEKEGGGEEGKEHPLHSTQQLSQPNAT